MYEIMKPNCYKCKHRRSILGDAHSRCYNPKLEINLDHPIFMFLTFLGKRGPRISIYTDKIGVKINKHGFDNGWANFPFNFNPIWIEKCDSFENKDGVEKQ